MGVMSCSRKDCDNIMCDTYISDFGYICGECKGEFKEYLVEMNEDKDNMTLRGIKLRLNAFMDTKKGTYSENEAISVDEFFNNNTQD